MSKLNIKTLIEKIVRKELKTIVERKEKTWREGDKISTDILNQTFKAFHFSNKFAGDSAKLTPRVPTDPWMTDYTIEDDFTKRISLGPTIEKAQEAIDGEDRPYLYAGDIRQDPDDDFETFETNNQIKNCPSSDNNEYGPIFSMGKWIDDLYDNDEIDGDTTEDIMDMMDIAGEIDFGPKSLPDELRIQFAGCVPDAEDTKELWSLKPVQLFLVAYNKNGQFELSSRGADILNKFKV